LQLCSFCGKNVVYIDQHIKIVHKDIIGDKFCEVCQKTIDGDMKKHRGICISCPFCDHQNLKKARLLKHIKVCLKRKKIFDIQSEPLNLVSPRKEVEIAKSHLFEEDKDLLKEKAKDETQILKVSPMPHGIECEIEPDVGCHDKTKQNDSVLDLSIRNKTSLSKKRTKYPFDLDGDEYYMSELEEDDSEEYTTERRYVKDKLEEELRAVDAIENLQVEGDEEIENQFKLFMESKKKRMKKEGGFSKMKQVTTVDLYTRVVRTFILPALHSLVSPFDARWLLDCTTPKDCTFSGQKRRFVNPEEPIYMTSTILEEILSKLDKKHGGNWITKRDNLGSYHGFLGFH
jgi:hypothetical protein